MTIEDMATGGLALPILPVLPEGCIMFTMHGTSCEPIVRNGECVAVDVTDQEAKEGALYLRRYTSSRRLEIVEALKLRTQYNPEGLWLLGPHRRHEDISSALAQGELHVFCDSPYDLESMRNRIIGRVVAILADTSAESMDAPLPVATMERGTYALIPLR